MKLNTKNIIQLARHISQAIFFLLFVFLLVGSACSFSVDWFRFTEPLGGLQTLFSNLANINLTTILAILSGVAVFVLVTILLGRVWCGWACPVGSLIELGEYVFGKTKIRKYVGKNRRGEKFLDKNTRHAVLGGVLASALISRNPAWCEVCPIGTICRTTSASGLIAIAETAIIGGVVSSSLYKKRFFCRYICPISSLLTIFSKLNIFIKPVVDKKICKECAICEKICPEGIPLYREEELAECTKCLECYSKCPHNSISIKTTSSIKPSMKTIATLTLTIIILATLIPFSYIYTTPAETTLTIYPEKFIVTPGETITINVKLLSYNEPVYSKEIYWWASEGFLDNSIGNTVKFTAPQSNENKTIEIRAIFYGDETYLPSNASTTIQVVYIRREPTTITIEPPTFIIKSNENITLRAVTSPPNLPGELIKWKLTGLGRLSNNSGITVTYYPPEEIQEEIRINVTVVFEGDVRHLPSTSYASGLIIPKHLEKKPTILTISPSSFTIKQGENITLKAMLKTVDGEEVEGIIKWRLEGPGRLSSITGREVIYHAPETIDRADVRIIAFFEGDGRYLSSESVATGIIIGRVPVIQELYEAKFRRMELEDIQLGGDIKFGNITLTILKVGKITVEDLNIVNLGFTSRRASLNESEIYLTHLTGEVGGATINLEDLKEQVQRLAIIENGVMIFTKLKCREAEFDDLSLIGEYIRGEEPYIPLIITAKDVKLSERYSLDSPKTYRELENKVMELISGKIETKNFSIIKPVNYHLERTLKKYQYSEKLLLNSSRILGENMTVYSIYYRVTLRIFTYLRYFGEYTVEATGDLDVKRIIFHFWTGWEIGHICHTINYAEVHAVYFRLDKCFINNLTLNSYSK
ncbi:MAG: 4Fe-4S binding protein [Thermoproteota archaeon]